MALQQLWRLMMDPTETNMFELIKQNCKRHYCSSFLGYGTLCETYKDCEILRSKLYEWNLLLFPERPCNECLVRPRCIDLIFFVREGYCQIFDQFWTNLVNQYNNADELLYPQLLCYYNLNIDDEDVSFIGAYYPEYLNKPYTPEGILKF
jgi:hypothetical protein